MNSYDAIKYSQKLMNKDRIDIKTMIYSYIDDFKEKGIHSDDVLKFMLLVKCDLIKELKTKAKKSDEKI